MSGTGHGGQSEPIPFNGFSVPRPSSADSGVSPGSSPGSVSGSVGPHRGGGLWLGAKKEQSAGPGLGLGREGNARKGEIGKESRGSGSKSAGERHALTGTGRMNGGRGTMVASVSGEGNWVLLFCMC